MTRTVLLLLLAAWPAGSRAAEEFYREPAWQPRAILPAAEALRGDFWPASPPVATDTKDSGFASSKLSPPPPPGVHPRVLVTPDDVEKIRAKVAMGDQAPPAFRALWERLKKQRGAFYALVAEDGTLGRALAADLVEKMRALEPKLDKLDARPDRDNLWVAERSIVASGDPDPPTEIWALLDYDYLHRWMTPEERALAERLIARITKGRITNFLAEPDHFMINNHKGFGMEFLRLLLLIEGREGFDQKVYDLATHKARAMLDWYLSPDGMCFESIKGWLNTSVFVALGRRDPDILKHSYLRAKMRFFQHALHWQDGRWQIRDEMRASAFHVIWMMRYFHPDDPLYDWLYSATLSTHPFLTDPSARWPDPVGVSPELLLLFAEEGRKGPDGKPLAWTDQKLIDARNLPTLWQDDARGYMIARNSWNKDDLQLGFTCKQDFFYGGHEGSENNRFVLWADGVNWVRDSNMLAVKATFLQNMLTIDGRGLSWPPAPGVWLGVKASEGGVLAAGDGKNGYDYSKVMQVHPLDFPSAQLPYYAPFAGGNFDLTRDQQIAFHPGTVAWNDGYAHTDYGPWSGETRLVESYRVNNPVERAYRTVYLARGPHPYVLVLDDARKDDQERLYEFNMTIPEGIDLIDSKTSEIAFQQAPPGAGRESDLLLGLASTEREPASGKAQPRKGDPLFLVRTLWRNSPYGFPVPSFRKLHVEPQAPYAGLGLVSIPAISDSPEFRILLYPHRQGDPLPSTSWNEDRTELTVSIGGITDLYRFGKTDGGRTVLSVERDGREVLRSGAGPARPSIEVRGTRFDPDTLRTTRREGTVPEYPFDGGVEVKMDRPQAPAFLVYTLDGSEPAASSPRYEKPLRITETSRLSARVIDPSWKAGPGESTITRADFTKTDPAAGTEAPPAGAQPGLLARVYEKKTVLWNDKGFFEAGKIMLPDLDQEKPVAASLLGGFELPYVNPSRPVSEQAKGFYRFTGWFRAPERGVYEFSVDSCGPVSLKVAGRAIISSKGVFHQQQAVRRGSTALAPGWHPIDLTVCDPLLWNVNSLGEMPFSVTVRRDAGVPVSVPPADLRADPGTTALSKQPEIPWMPAVNPPAWLEPGLDLLVFEREGKSRDPEYLDVDAIAPVSAALADKFEPGTRPSLVRVYEAWFHAPMDGIYAFDLPASRDVADRLAGLPGMCQNQLRIDGEVAAQRGVAGRRPPGKLGLKEGWHRMSLRLGASDARGTITYPDGQSRPLSAIEWMRPARIGISLDDAGSGASLQEFFQPARVVLTLPRGKDGTIRYTLDGSEPTGSSPVFRDSIRLDKSTTVTAAAFLKDGSATARNRVEFCRVKKPESGLIGAASFEGWDGRTGAVDLGGPGQAWIAPGSVKTDFFGRTAVSVHRKAEEDKPASDVNVARPRSNAGLKLSGLRMPDDAITVGLWFRSATGSGKLFGKDGYSAFGKAYRTVSCSLRNGRLQASPGNLSGGTVNTGEWSHVVLTADAEATRLYLNGKEVASGPGSHQVATDALDFLSEHPASIGEVRVYGRILKPEDIQAWYAADAPAARSP